MLRFGAMYLLLLPSLALAAPPISAAAESGRVTFQGRVVQGEAGGLAGIGVPANRRATSHFRVSLTIVATCDTHVRGKSASSRCTAKTATPRISWKRAPGSTVMVTTVYY